MTDLRKAAERALEALEGYPLPFQAPIKEALRQALAQSEQEPVAWINKDGWFRSPKDADDDFRACAYPLYTAPPKREWVGLTDEERRDIREWQEIQKELGPVWAPMMLYLYVAIEAKLKEKNT